jgi:hypothetical protein
LAYHSTDKDELWRRFANYPAAGERGEVSPFLCGFVVVVRGQPRGCDAAGDQSANE